MPIYNVSMEGARWEADLLGAQVLLYLQTNGSSTRLPRTQRARGELLALMAQGRSNQESAEQLGLSLKTVRNHVSTVFSKLQVADRAQAVIRAREAGLG